MLYSDVQCSAVHCSAVRCIALHCIAVQFSTMHCSSVKYSAVQCSTVQDSTVQCSAVQCSAVQCSAVQCSAVQCSARVAESWEHGKQVPTTFAPPPTTLFIKVNSTKKAYFQDSLRRTGKKEGREQCSDVQCKWLQCMTEP